MHMFYALSGLLLGLISVSGFSETPAKSRKVEIDTTHSCVVFKVKHQKVSWFYGRFNKFQGSITLDGDKSAVSITIDATSVDTANEGRDRHLRGPDFFNTKQFPEIQFESSSVSISEDEQLHIKGKLTICGVTKEISAVADKTGEGTARGKPIVGYHSVITLKRSDFGITYGKGGIGDDVEVIFSLECKG